MCSGLPRERIGRSLKVRVPVSYVGVLRVLAVRSGVSVAEYVRGLLHAHIVERGAAFRERGAALNFFIHAVKEYVLLYREGVAIATGLPAKERRSELERKTWEAFQKAYELFQSEEVAANAKARVRVMEVLANLARTERAILADMDKAEVDDLMDRLEESLSGLEKETAKGSREKGES